MDTDDLSRTAEELRTAASDRAATVRHELLEQAEHARELGDELRHRTQERLVELEPVARRARIGGWSALRALIGGLAALPAVLVKGLGGAAHAADELSERGSEFGERARELLHELPTPRRVRRRQRLRLAVWTGAGFGVGLGLGWFLGRRNAAPVSYGQPQPVTGLEVPPPGAGAGGAVADRTEAVRERAKEATARAGAVAATAGGVASDVAGIAGDAASDLADTVADTGTTAGDAAREAADEVKETVDAASELTAEVVADAAAEVRDEASGPDGAGSDEADEEDSGTGA